MASDALATAVQHIAPALVGSYYRLGFVPVGPAARMILGSYLLLSKRNGVPCTISCKNIAKILAGEDASAAEQAALAPQVTQVLYRWDRVVRLGHNGDRGREWQLVSQGV